MEHFRRLMTAALIAGAVSGVVLWALQFVAIGPLIARAETYEAADAHQGHEVPSGGASNDAASHEMAHPWEPADGIERTMYTLAGTILTGIGFSAVLFGIAAALGLRLDARRGIALGLAGFACCALAPAIGLPPKPPGAAAAELRAAQLWWVGTATVTGFGLWIIASANGSWLRRFGGALLIVLPHAIGAPAPAGHSVVPADLSRQFALASVITQAVFWILLGAIGGPLSARAAVAGQTHHG
jgi:cobalt transporter subunit CbtA